VSNGLAPLELDARALHGALERAAELSRNWIGIPPEAMKELLRSIVARVTLLADRIDVTIGADRLAHALGASTASVHDAGSTVDLSVAAELRRSGQGKRMVVGDPHQAASDASLVNVLKEAVAAQQKLLADTDETLNEITERTTKSKGRLTALTRLSYLAPDIIAAILAGRQPPELSVKRLLRTSQDLPLDWPGQRAFLGLA
ncbi:MAG: recombinase family protein, partial [Hyphomonas sp.]